MVDQHIYSLRALALLSGLSQNTMYLALKRGSFNSTTADAIANALDCLSHDVMVVVQDEE
jgi:lambda repressor-like predicted transcriptional regulator